MRISDWSSDVCSSDLLLGGALDMLLNRTYRNTVPLCNLLIFPTLDTSQHEYDPGSIRQRLKYFHGAREALLLCQDVLGRKIHTCVKRFVKLIMRSEEHTSELQSLMRISYAVFCLKK